MNISASGEYSLGSETKRGSSRTSSPVSLASNGSCVVNLVVDVQGKFLQISFQRDTILSDGIVQGSWVLKITRNTKSGILEWISCMEAGVRWIITTGFSTSNQTTINTNVFHLDCVASGTFGNVVTGVVVNIE